jgi:SAM-dependent methyltransferase
MIKTDIPAPLINWPELLRLSRFHMSENKSEKGVMWDHAADMYNKMAAMEREYTIAQLDAFDTSPEDTVLDVGCGPGRISVPMAQRAKSVTAIDNAEKMLHYCKENARKAGVQNLTALLLDWKNAVLGENLEKHDIVIASRSEGMKDIEKLTSFARKYAVMIAWANSPCIPDILGDLFYGTSAYKKRGSPGQRDRRLGYNIFYNMVYDLGYDPNIKIVTDGFTKDYADYEEAYDDLRTLGKIEDDEMEVFRNNCNRWLSENEKGGITFRRETKSFVLWWSPEKRF